MLGADRPSVTLGRKPTWQDWTRLGLAVEATQRLTGMGLPGTCAAMENGVYDIVLAQLRAALRDGFRGGELRQSAREHQVRLQSQAWTEWLLAVDLPLKLTDEAGPPPPA